ncbi:MAG TPA: hypothetical protein VE077_18115 [Candidatus Methylomirabilis sp.]|nr:hypothetical protein [Candidatus Methylomirabilis sp.]
MKPTCCITFPKVFSAEKLLLLVLSALSIASAPLCGQSKALPPGKIAQVDKTVSAFMAIPATWRGKSWKITLDLASSPD